MKVLVVLGIAIICLVMMLSSAGKAQERSLILYCPFTEGKGDETADVSGHHEPGTLNGGVEWTDGKYGSALSFNGLDSFVEIPNSGILDPENLTVEMWLKPNFGGVPICVGHSDNQAGWYVQLETRGAVGIYFAVDASNWAFCDTIPIQEGKFQHLAVTYDGDKASFYLDGKPEGLVSGSLPLQSYDGSLIMGKSSDRDVVDPDSCFYSGILDEVAIYSKALTNEEIERDFSEGVPSAVEPSDKLATSWGSIKTNVFSN